MMAWLTHRPLHFLIVVWGVTTLVFVALRMTGDPAVMLLPGDPTMAEINLMREKLGLNKPLIEQYVVFVGNAFRGDFGQSFRHGVPASSVVLERLPATALLAFSALALAAVVAIPMGILAAVNRGRLADLGVMLLAVIGQGVPFFWLGLMLILVFGVEFRMFPTGGYGSIQHLVLPSVTLAAYIGASTARIARSSMLEVLGQDYMRTARAKGLALYVVVLKHGLRNAAIPLVTYLGLQMGLLLGGTVVVEEIFAWPGVGRLLLQAISFRDYPVVQAATFILAMIFVVVNLLVDIVYTVLDPRVRDRR
ncbi:MAG: ABC transporter permease [Alphaproteobacteria bacterium]|nr:ABC transporter permease [Alphaproteobacteria bacterium]